LNNYFSEGIKIQNKN